MGKTSIQAMTFKSIRQMIKSMLKYLRSINKGVLDVLYLLLQNHSPSLVQRLVSSEANLYEWHKLGSLALWLQIGFSKWAATVRISLGSHNYSLSLPFLAQRWHNFLSLLVPTSYTIPAPHQDSLNSAYSL